MSDANGTWDFIDALRVVLGLRPLYRFGGEAPCYERAALAQMTVAIGDGNRRTPTTDGFDHYGMQHRAPGEDAAELTPRELARLRASKPLRRGAHRLDGQRVGMPFVSLGRRS